MQMPCAGGGKGRPRPLHLPARGVAPGNPDSMHGHAKRLAHMPTGRMEQAAHDRDLDLKDLKEVCLRADNCDSY